MAGLTSVSKMVDAFYRLVGSTTSDDALTEQGESTDEVAYHCLTQGIWRAQRYMIGEGMQGRWLARSSAITSWTGTDAADGGTYTTLPADFLMLSGDEKRSALVEADGTPWGKQVGEDRRYYMGDYFYLRDEQLWLAKKARPKATLYIEYEARHAALASGTLDADIDFPLEARPLVISEAADYGIEDGWCVRDEAGKQAVSNRLEKDKRAASRIAKQSREPRKTKPATMIGTRYLI